MFYGLWCLTQLQQYFSYIVVVSFIGGGNRSTRRKPPSSWTWSYGSWIYNYLCNQCLSPLTLWVRIPLRRGVLDSTICDKVCQWLATCRWFSPWTPVSSTNKPDTIMTDPVFVWETLIINNILMLQSFALINKYTLHMDPRTQFYMSMVFSVDSSFLHQ
jgi:hypothetical protein